MKNHPSTIRIIGSGSESKAVLELLKQHEYSVAIDRSETQNELFSLAKKALLAGDHVFIESLHLLTSAQIKELADIAFQQETIVTGRACLHTHPALAEISRMARAGYLGTIEHLSVFSGQDTPDLRSNPLITLPLEGLTMVQLIAGESPTKLSQEAKQNHIVTSLTFTSGLEATIRIDATKDAKTKLVLVGMNKAAVMDNGSAWEEMLQIHNTGNPEEEPETISLSAQTGPEILYNELVSAVSSTTHTMAANGNTLRMAKLVSLCEQHAKSHIVRFPRCTIHATAEVDDNVNIGPGTAIWHVSHVLSGSTIGENCNIGQNVVIGPDVHIGNGCKIQNNVSVYPGVELEDNVFCGPSMCFTNVFNPRAEIPRKHEIRKTHVQKGASLGGNCTVVCGNSIGKYAFVGAGAVITRDVPAHALMIGNPARRAGWMCCCGEKLDENLTCTKCGATYREKENGLV